MADIDNMRGDTLRVVEENTLDNMRGVTQRVINENSIDNTRGVTYRVYNVNPAPAPVIDELNVTPSTSAQTITAPSGTDGYSPVNVAAVTSSIDANITAGNIKKDVSILGVTGSYEGNVPTGTMYIISNGTYNVADKAIANVQVPTTAPELYRVFRSNNGKLDNSISTAFIQLPSSITDVGDFCLCNCYKNTPSSVLSGAVDLSNLTQITGMYACNSMFYNCTGITSVDLSNLTTISGTNACSNMFDSCSGITNIDLSNLTTISGNNMTCYRMFYKCTGITSVNLSSLTAISGTGAVTGIFDSCSILISVKFNKLNTIAFDLSTNPIRMFANCFKLESVEFGGLKSSTFTSKKTQLRYLFDSSTGRDAPNGCTVHFPSNFDPSDPNHTFDASTLTGYPTFGGNASYIHVAFDLPATE